MDLTNITELQFILDTQNLSRKEFSNRYMNLLNVDELDLEAFWDKSQELYDYATDIIGDNVDSFETCHKQ